MSNNIGFLSSCEQYHLNCQIVKVNRSFRSDLDGHTYTNETISLIPDVSTQQMLLFSKHLPMNVYRFMPDEYGVTRESDIPDGYEMFCMFPYPMAHFGKVMFCRGNHYVAKTHFHVMTMTSIEMLSTKSKNLFEQITGRNKINGLIVYPNLADELDESQMIQIESEAGIGHEAINMSKL
jgi:hypothetical protein